MYLTELINSDSMIYYLATQWHTGMSLLAQHFQQDKRYYHQQLLHILSCNKYPLYGLISCEYELVDQTLRINQLHAIFPELIVVQIMLDDLDDYLDIELKHDGSIFLTMPTNQVLDQKSYQIVQSKALTDEFDENSVETISLLSPKLKLVLGEKPPAKHHYLKLFEIKHGKIADYHSAFVKWNLDHNLWVQLNNLRVKMRDKINYINTQSKTSLEKLDAIRSQLIVGLVNFEHALLSQSHPQDVYEKLINIAAHLITDQAIPKFEYAHDNVVKSFQECIALITDQLNRIQEHYTQTAFARNQHFWQLQLSDLFQYKIKDKTYIICSAHMIENYEFLDDWINSCVIAGNGNIDQLISSRVLGCSREICEFVDELNIKSVKDSLFFKIEIDPNFIKDSDTTLMIYHNKIEKQTPDNLYGYA